MEISVIICTHNPRMDFLAKVLDALRAQSLPSELWELLVIDNASNNPLADTLDLSWRPHARVIREETLGLTPARLRGIREASGDLLVFVDDDNVLAERYLSEALNIERAWPMLGVWGGSIEPWFEVEPPAWSVPYHCYLALRTVSEDCWSNFKDNPGLMPWGAGMCVRRMVALEYARVLASDPIRRSLDRRGQSLGSCGDSDLAMIACDMGFGTGLYRKLRLTHLISDRRLEEPYLMKLTEGMGYSLTILSALHGRSPRRCSWPGRLRGYATALRRGLREFRFYRASERGAKAAAREIATWNRPELLDRKTATVTSGKFVREGKVEGVS
jgi:glycosyltransferase involved in cell wall biosynthesis